LLRSMSAGYCVLRAYERGLTINFFPLQTALNAEAGHIQ
jgi:hypothetical protein